MRKSSTGRSSSSNPVRMSTYDREDKTAGRPDARRTQMLKSKGQSQVDNSQIPRPRIRSSSSERTSIRKSNLKIHAKTPVSQSHHGASRVSSTTPITPRVSSNRLCPEPSSGTRHRSPSAERASGFGAKGPRKDTRPINDKAYQSTMLNKIDQYFSTINKISLLNPSGSLRPVTLKIFIETTGCLLRLLDVKHDVSINNYMEELPKIAKKLHYPGTVTKSWLKTANTMHSWPQVLAWLSWLVEVCEAKDMAACAFEIEKLPFVGTNGKDEVNRSTFLSMLKFYAAWNEERLEEEAALVEQHVQNLNNQHGDIETDITEAQANLDKEKASFHAMDQQTSEIDGKMSDIKEILDSLKQEDCKEMEWIDATEGCIQRVVREIEQLNVDSKTLEDKIQMDSTQHEELNILVENQPMSIKERDRIVKQCSEIQTYIHQFDNHVKDIEKELYSMDIKFAASNQNLYKAILSYNKDIIMYLGCDTGADLEELKMPETNMLSTDFTEVLRLKETAMLNVKEHIKKQLSQMESQIDASTNELESLEEKLRILREENKSHVERMTEQRISVQQIQRRAKETELKLKGQMKNVEADLVKLQRSMPDLESAVNELTEARDKYEAVVRRHQFMEKSAERFFNKFYQILAKHRNDLSILLKKLPKSDP